MAKGSRRKQLERRNRRRLASARKDQRRALRAAGVLPPTLQLRDYDIIVAPPVLGWSSSEIPDLLRFLADIRQRARDLKRPILLDLRGCTRITSPGCLMLAAEIERCQRAYGQHLAIRVPVDSNARWLIGAYGLHNRVQCDMKLNSQPSPYIMKIVSGGRTPGEEPRVNPGELTYRVATLAERVFKDDRFADQLHSALNEASDNVIGHAYEELDGVDAAAGRWWVSGIADAKEQVAYFFVYDQGATIPVTAPKTFGEQLAGMLSAFGISRKDALDHHILRATIQQKRTQTRQEERGKGLGHMIGLIDDAKAGSISIVSGGAYYLYTRSGDDAEPVEGSGPLGSSLPGTLVVWEVLGGARREEVTDANVE